MLNKSLTELQKILESISGNDEQIALALKKIEQIREDENEMPRVFTVKHYVSDDHPSLRGIGFDLFVADDREEVEDFAKDLNRLLAQIPPRRNTHD